MKKERSEEDATRLHHDIFDEENEELVSPNSTSRTKDNTTFLEKQASEEKTSQENISSESQLVTEATFKALTDSGIDVVEATDEMAMAVLGNTPNGIELMAQTRQRWKHCS